MSSSAQCDVEIGQMPPQIAFESAKASISDSMPDVRNGDDEAMLIAQARNGSSAAAEQLVGRYERKILRLAQNITRNYEDAEEAVQNAFVKAFRNLAAFRGDSRFYTWLVRIAVNEALMKIRGKRFREVSIDSETEAENQVIASELQDSGPDPEERYAQEELRTILAKSIGRLIPGYRTVFHLREVEGFSTEETARALGLSCTAVKSRLRRARLQLRYEMDAWWPPSRLSGDTHDTTRSSEALS